MTDKLFKRSKIICDKINKANCLEANELLEVEMAMRTSDFYEQILNEAIAFDMDNDIGEIKFFEFHYNIENFIENEHLVLYENLIKFVGWYELFF